MRRDLALSTVLALLASMPAAAQDWDPILWNPQPLPGDIVLPMPCGGAMAFRRIDTPGEPNWMADAAIRMGSSNAAGQEHSESVLGGRIVGGLTETAADGRFYLMGKYEVTADQWRALMDEACPVPDEEGSLPAERMSALAAQDFAARYTEWLYSHAREALPAVPGAYLRLPTEEEWAFAARGGLAVTEAERRAELPPLEGTLADNVWFAGFKSCDGLSQPIGILEPNPLGLFDMLGNVQELTATLYRMRGRERMHGQTGGTVARGGSCLTGEQRVRTAARDEIAPVDPETGRPQGKAFTGLRLAMGAPILAEAGRIGEISEDWQSLGRMRMAFDPEDDPVAMLAALAEAEEREAVREALRLARARFETEMARRNEVEGLSARATAQAGLLGVRSTVLALDNIAYAKAVLADVPTDPDLRAYLARAQERMAISEDTLLGMIVHGATGFPAEVFDDAVAIVARENAARVAAMSPRTRESTQEMLTIFAGFVRRYRDEASTDPAVFRTGVQDYYDRLLAAQ